ncbi:MAG: hypothetical protein ABIN20_01120 [candidate division WOR-3 bacterium]
MNKWVQKSIKLAKSEFYLDKLLKIYPPEEISREKALSEQQYQLLKRLFKEKNCKDLVKELIHLKKQGFKFPIENPYVSFLTHYEEAIDKNPKTIRKICDKLFEMNFNELKEKLEAPKKPSRRIGPMFKIWLKEKFDFLDINEFRKTPGIVFLNGGDKFLKEYATRELKCKFRELSKGLDFVAKINNKYIIGTAKFITDFGGSQDNQFKEAVSLVKETLCPYNVVKVAVIDGVAWLGGEMKLTLEKLKNNEFCFSALLLEEFIKNQL